MSLRNIFVFFLLLLVVASPAAGQEPIADFTFSDVSDMPASLLKNSIEGQPDALSINERARSDGEGVYTLNDPNDPSAHVNISLEIPKDMLEAHKSIYLEWDYKSMEGEGGSAWLVKTGSNNHFGIFHHSDKGFVVRYYTLEERAGAAATPFLTKFIPTPLEAGERAIIAFHYNQEEGMAYLYKNEELIWKTTDSSNDDGIPFEPTPGHAFYWFTEGESLTVGAGMNAGGTETPTLFRFRAFPDLCNDDSPASIVEEETISDICYGESATLVATANDAESYQWYLEMDSGELSKIEGATDSLYITEPLTTDQNFWVKAVRGPCDIEPVEVAVTLKNRPEKPQVSNVSNCGPTELTLQAAGGPAAVSYQWYRSNGDTPEAISGETASTFTTGYLEESATFYVTALNEDGCESDTARVDAIINEIPASPVVEVQPELRCGPGEVTVAIQTPDGKDFTYNWYRSMDFNSLVEEKTSNTLTLNVTKDTAFYVRAVNGECIGPHYRVNIKVSPVPSIEARASTNTIIKGESISLQANFNPDSVNASSLRWEPSTNLAQPGSATTMASPTVNTTYTLYAESLDGCPLSDTVTILVADEFPVTNAFSPNGDGYQDTWEIHNLDQDKYRNCKIMVYNGWGNQVFYCEGYDKSKEWDGTSNGQPLPAGTYYYTIILNESQEPLRGSLLIMR
jgi:gliding motility-associated-like protein